MKVSGKTNSDNIKKTKNAIEHLKQLRFAPTCSRYAWTSLGLAVKFLREGLTKAVATRGPSCRGGVRLELHGRVGAPGQPMIGGN
jgi:hypothetical protein